MSALLDIQGTYECKGFLFRQQEDVLTDQHISVAPEPLDDEEPDEGYIICKNCQNILTKSSNKIVVNGSHRHIFANPHGLVFEIGCFSDVSGCGHAGVPTSEFSWFSGYKWRIAVCANCIAHLGWGFSGGESGIFHGLILNHIAETGSQSSKGLY